MSTFENDLARVVELASAIEDRDRGDQRALLRVAHWVDLRLNRQTITNPAATETFTEPSRRALMAGCDARDCKVCNRIPTRTLPNPA